MDWLLTLKLFSSLFSLNRKNMRWFNWKRVMVSLFLLPPFTLLLIINRVFLLLDYLFFPWFIRTRIKDPVFIISAPRSATTFLFHKLSSQKEKFTSFRLWEIMFAPSILQKYLVFGFFTLDKLIGRPLQRLILAFERIILYKFRHIHLMGLDLPEEDEAILFWNMSTVYLNFFFPDTTYFEDYFLFDDKLSEYRKRRVMNYYFRCVQRHNFVFNQKGQRRFLSKNPSMMSKVKTLHQFFSDATILTINRCPAEVIPSTISLNENIYSFFTSHKTYSELNNRTIELLIQWYMMAHHYSKEYFEGKVMEIDFKKLISGELETITSLCKQYDIPESVFKKESVEKKSDEIHKSKNKYQRLNETESAIILERIPFMKKYCN